MSAPQQPIRLPARNVNDLARERAEARRTSADPRAAVTQQAAEQEPDAERTFPERSAVQVARPAPTFTIHALLDDFPIEIAFSGSADQLKATVARLRELGAVPPTPAARQAVAEEKAREAPVCPYHGPMKESAKAPGTWYCTKRMGDGSYCKERA